MLKLQTFQDDFIYFSATRNNINTVTTQMFKYSSILIFFSSVFELYQFQHNIIYIVMYTQYYPRGIPNHMFVCPCIFSTFGTKNIYTRSHNVYITVSLGKTGKNQIFIIFVLIFALKTRLIIILHTLIGARGF